MIVSPKKELIISSVGWVDKGSLSAWYIEKKDEPCTLRLSDASYLTVHEGTDGYFSVCHRFDGAAAVEITAHSFDDPTRMHSKWRIEGARSSVEGDPTVWRFLERFYVAFLSRGNLPGQSEYRLIYLTEFGDAEIIDLDWYDESYDKGYQGIISVQPIPGSENLIFSVQRDAEPVVYDLTMRQAIGKIVLAGNYGNPKLHFRTGANELWAIDYDTLLCLEIGSWTVKNSLRLQGCEGDGYREFVGEFCFHGDSLCSVARPFSGDVVTLDMDSFDVVGTTTFPKQPLQVAVIDGMVFVRDWKTGEAFKSPLKLGNV